LKKSVPIHPKQTNQEQALYADELLTPVRWSRAGWESLWLQSGQLIINFGLSARAKPI